MIEHNKRYDTSEELEYRMKVYQENVKKIEELNKAYNPRTRFGINKFADLSESEFRAKYLSSKKPIRDPSWPVVPEVPKEKLKDLPESFDWRDKGAVTPVK